MKILFHIFGLPVHFFGVMIALGILAGIIVAYLEAKRKKLDTDRISDLALYGIISAVIGARLFYILFYDFSYYLNNPIDIIKINEGGLSIHGGLIGAFVFGLFYFKKYKLNFFKYADAIAPGIILGQAIGRVGCDVFGKVMTEALPWGIERQGMLLHPAQLYEFVLNYIVFFILWRKRKNLRYDGQLFLWYIILFSINRGVVELFRYNPAIAGWFSISHLLSFIMILGAIIVMFILKNKKHNHTEADMTETDFNKSFDLIKDIMIVLLLIAISVFIFYTVQA